MILRGLAATTSAKAAPGATSQQSAGGGTSDAGQGGDGARRAPILAHHASRGQYPGPGIPKGRGSGLQFERISPRNQGKMPASTWHRRCHLRRHQRPQAPTPSNPGKRGFGISGKRRTRMAPAVPGAAAEAAAPEQAADEPGGPFPKRSWVLLWGILPQIIIVIPNIETLHSTV